VVCGTNPARLSKDGSRLLGKNETGEWLIKVIIIEKRSNKKENDVKILFMSWSFDKLEHRIDVDEYGQF